MAVKRGPPPLDGDGPASKGVRRIIGAALGQLLANQPAAAAATSKASAVRQAARDLNDIIKPPNHIQRLNHQNATLANQRTSA